MTEIKLAGYVRGLSHAGFSISEVKAAGFMLSEIKLAGYVRGLSHAGFSISEVKAAGFTLLYPRNRHSD